MAANLRDDADTWRELLFDLLADLPPLADPARWALPERMAAHRTFRRCLEAQTAYHERRAHALAALPRPRPGVIDLTDLTATTGGSSS